MKQDNKIKAIEKALEILLALTPHNQEMGTSEISQKQGLLKATASRILLFPQKWSQGALNVLGK